MEQLGVDCSHEGFQYSPSPEMVSFGIIRTRHCFLVVKKRRNERTATGDGRALPGSPKLGSPRGTFSNRRRRGILLKYTGNVF